MHYLSVAFQPRQRQRNNLFERNNTIHTETNIMSPQLSSNRPSIDSSLKDPNYSDPYLSAPLDPDEAAFRSSAIRLTPVPDDIPPASSPAPSSDFHTSGVPAPSIDTTCFDQNSLHPDNSSASVFSLGEELLSSPSISSHNADYGMAGLNLNLAGFTYDWQPNPHTSLETQQHGLGPMQLSSPQSMMPASHLLSPVLTDHTSPNSDVANNSYFPSGNDALLSPEGSQKNGTLRSSLITSPLSDSLSIHADPESVRARSPIVMVEDTSGDAPANTIHSRRPSSAYLSPGGLDEEEVDDDCSSISRASDGSWIRDTATGHGGVDPTSRDDIWVPSPNEMEAQRQLIDKQADIHSWTASVSAATSEVGDDNFLSVRGRGARPAHRRRAKSTGDASLQQDYFNYRSQVDSLLIPGPGVLIQEKSDVGSSDPGTGSRSGSPVASIRLTTEDEMDQDIPVDQPNFDHEEPLSSQFIRARPWQDPALDPFLKASKLRPHNSIAAIEEFQQRARELDTASRMATWGTRIVNDAEVSSIVGGDSMGKLTIGDQDKGRERRGSLLSLLPRASSPLKRQRSAEFNLDASALGSNSLTMDNQSQAGVQRKTSVSSHRRKLSIGRSPRSTSISAGGAMAAIAGSMATIGGGSRLSPGPPGWTRGRSKSEVPPPPPDLMAGFGGLSPTPSPGLFPEKPRQSIGTEVGREDDDDDEEEEGMVMEFPLQSCLPVLTHDGFKAQIAQLNPRLAPALVDRLANEQVRRYKKLVDQKVNHSRAVGSHSCGAGKYCFGQGGEAKILLSRTSNAQDANAQTQFQISGPDAEDLGEGTVTAAQFPPGVPLPPVQRLPAEFECPFCFKVKSFQKPSDWSKHVHEDVQPFTCTFLRCNEPKSFKRKADWVRHESERHRQLEWWTCTMPDCGHTCYRKDNFVQHLVREHKMPEPKAKKGTSKNKGESQRDREIAQLWELVENCRHETTKNPRDEPCRFCGNVCSSWKKLTVHLAKHMEQIALPVLGLVQEREVGPTHTNSSPAAISRPKADMPMAFGQDDSTPSFNLTYPPPSLTTTQDGFLSAEPESMNLYEELASPQFLHPEAGHHSPLHQSSVSYPPPFNAMSRPHTPSNHDINSNSDVTSFYSPSPVMLSPPAMDSSFDAQGSMFLSPTTEDYFKLDLTATSLSYDSGMAHHLQNQYM